jgi:preprotein translocase subunit SecF
MLLLLGIIALVQITRGAANLGIDFAGGTAVQVKVVVFDRIRENRRARRRATVESVINTSINQVLSRTVVVSLTVILVLIPLAVSGGEVLHDFSLALLVGVIIGTYSSVVVASPLLVLRKTPADRLAR